MGLSAKGPQNDRHQSRRVRLGRAIFVEVAVLTLLIVADLVHTDNGVFMSDWVQEIESLVGDRRETVSCKWLRENFNIPIDFAKKILFEAFERHAPRCDAVFCVVGVMHSSDGRSIQLVKHEDLTACLKKYRRVSSVHIQCLGPKNSISVINLVNMKGSELECFFEKLRLGPSATSVKTEASTEMKATEVRRASREMASRKKASNSIDESELTSPSKRQIKDRNETGFGDRMVKRRPSDEKKDSAKKAKKTKIKHEEGIDTGVETADRAETDVKKEIVTHARRESERIRSSIRHLSKEKKQTSLASFFSKK